MIGLISIKCIELMTKSKSKSISLLLKLHARMESKIKAKMKLIVVDRVRHAVSKFLMEMNTEV